MLNHGSQACNPHQLATFTQHATDPPSILSCTADSLKMQAGQLVDAVAVFRLSPGAGGYSAAPVQGGSSHGATPSARLEYRSVTPRQISA